MYKHILVPTDGSKVSEGAADAAIALARAVGARLTALHVVAPPAQPQLECWVHGDPDYGAKLIGALERRGLLYLDAVREAAMRAGVACECVIAHGVSPAGQIMREARLRECDLIMMSSHGPRGAGGIAGSETLKVVAMGSIPVLAHHANAEAVEPIRRQRVA
jgi:nucleotide-binding universal stress UspA family protein